MMSGESGQHASRMRARGLLGRHVSYNVSTKEIRVDDSLKTSPAPVPSAPTKWGWVRALHMRSETVKILVAFLLLGALCLLTWMHYKEWDPLAPCPGNDNVNCHFETTEDDLPAPDTKPSIGVVQLLTDARARWGHHYGDDAAPARDARNIFFVHATCERDLTPLQACAVEAASRLHPRWAVRVLFAGPVSLRRAVEGVLGVIAFPNVRFARVAVLDYLWHTPYYHTAWVLSLGKKSYKSTETLLRFGTLFKHDGVVLELSRVVRAPLDWLGGDFVTTERGGISAAAIGLEKRLRKEFSANFAREITRMTIPACADFTGEPALGAVVNTMTRARTEGVTETLRVYSLTNGTRGPLFRPPTAGPTLEDCPSVFNYTTHLKKTQQ